MQRSKLHAERVSSPREWLVEALDLETGDIYSAVFYGTEARERAEEYASEKFATVRKAWEKRDA